MVKLYIGIGIFLIISWILTWFTVKGLYKSLDQGEESKIAKFFLPKDYMRNLEMIEKRAKRLQQEKEEQEKNEEMPSDAGDEDEEKIITENEEE